MLLCLIGGNLGPGKRDERGQAEHSSAGSQLLPAAHSAGHGATEYTLFVIPVTGFPVSVVTRVLEH